MGATVFWTHWGPHIEIAWFFKVFVTVSKTLQIWMEPDFDEKDVC
jgi:hypothetical protein